jgi:hypothetical protein
METKTCRQCLETKEVTEFYKSKDLPGGYRNECKDCKNKKTMKWRKQNKEAYNAAARVHHKRHYERNRLYRYKLTSEQYQDAVKRQKGLCGICDKPNQTKDKKLVIDHDHKTGKFRALLCYKCNRDMNVIDDFEQLQKCVAYKKLHG